MKAHLSMILVFLAFTLLCTGCNEKKRNSSSLEHPAEHTDREKNNPTLYPSHGMDFLLGNHEGIVHPVSMENGRLLFKNISHPIVILHFFSPWSRPCQGEASYLTQLQKKYDDLFIMGILLHPDKQLEALDHFIHTYDAHYFIATGKENDRFARQVLSKIQRSNTISIPLTVIYHGGHYYRHYEGAVPIEMIEHDIKTILE